MKRLAALALAILLSGCHNTPAPLPLPLRVIFEDCDPTPPIICKCEKIVRQLDAKTGQEVLRCVKVR